MSGAQPKVKMQAPTHFTAQAHAHFELDILSPLQSANY